MHSGVLIGQIFTQDEAGSQALKSSDRRRATVSTLSNHLGSDFALAKHLISVADDAYAAGSFDLAEHFVELARELLDGV